MSDRYKDLYLFDNAIISELIYKIQENQPKQISMYTSIYIC